MSPEDTYFQHVRLDSFLNKNSSWKQNKRLKKVKEKAQKLARSGLYMDPTASNKEQCRCYYCGVFVAKVELDCDICSLHKAECPLLILSADNADMLSQECKEARKVTFGDLWPCSWDSCSVEKMAEAGFIYNPDSSDMDNVLCIYCDFQLSGWEESDDPLNEHQSRKARTCPFLLKLCNKTEEESLEEEEAGNITVVEIEPVEAKKPAAKKASKKVEKNKPTSPITVEEINELSLIKEPEDLNEDTITKPTKTKKKPAAKKGGRKKKAEAVLEKEAHQEQSSELIEESEVNETFVRLNEEENSLSTSSILDNSILDESVLVLSTTPVIPKVVILPSKKAWKKGVVEEEVVEDRLSYSAVLASPIEPKRSKRVNKKTQHNKNETNEKRVNEGNETIVLANADDIDDTVILASSSLPHKTNPTAKKTRKGKHKDSPDELPFAENTTEKASASSNTSVIGSVLDGLDDDSSMLNHDETVISIEPPKKRGRTKKVATEAEDSMDTISIVASEDSMQTTSTNRPIRNARKIVAVKPTTKKTATRGRKKKVPVDKENEKIVASSSSDDAPILASNIQEFHNLVTSFIDKGEKGMGTFDADMSVEEAFKKMIELGKKKIVDEEERFRNEFLKIVGSEG